MIVKLSHTGRYHVLPFAFDDRARVQLALIFTQTAKELTIPQNHALLPLFILADGRLRSTYRAPGQPTHRAPGRYKLPMGIDDARSGRT